jgi:hypothetical protein
MAAWNPQTNEVYCAYGEAWRHLKWQVVDDGGVLQSLPFESFGDHCQPLSAIPVMDAVTGSLDDPSPFALPARMLLILLKFSGVERELFEAFGLTPTLSPNTALPRRAFALLNCLRRGLG